MKEGNHGSEEEPFELLRINGTVASIGCVIPVRGHALALDWELTKNTFCLVVSLNIVLAVLYERRGCICL